MYVQGAGATSAPDEEAEEEVEEETVEVESATVQEGAGKDTKAKK